MSYINPSRIILKDGPQLDAFGRLRVSEPFTLFASTSEYDTNPLYFDTIFTGTGSVVQVANKSYVNVSTGGALSGASAVYQTRAYHRYQPGKSQEIEATFALGAAATGVRRRVGYFDANDGLFLEQTATDVAMVVRSSVSGSIVNNRYLQGAWNLDKLDGTGPSGITLDLSKAQIFHIDFQWLGEGRVRFGFVLSGLQSGLLVYCHEVTFANVIDVPYMATGSLPVRAEIENTSAAGGTNTIRWVCCTVKSEGGFEEVVSIPTIGGRTALVGTGTGGVVHAAVRPKTTFNGRVNRGQIYLREVVTISGGDGYWILWHGATVTGGAWASAGTHSIAELNTTATTLSVAGTPIAYGYLSGTGGARENQLHLLEHRIPLCLGADGATQTTAALVLYSFAVSPNMAGGLSWEEYR